MDSGEAGALTRGRKLRFSRMSGSFTICRVAAGTAIPAWAMEGSFYSVSSTPDELSIVCAQEHVPSEVRCESEWACLKLEGPFPFSETGILSSFVQPLAESAIPIFAIATFETDYVLVKLVSLEKALQALKDAGHQEI